MGTSGPDTLSAQHDTGSAPRKTGWKTPTIRISSLIAKFALPIVAVWVFAAAALNLFAPPFESLLKNHDRPLFPTNTESAAALMRMGKAFGESITNNQAVLIVEKDRPFDQADRQYRLDLLRQLTDDKEHVKSVFDMWSDPQLAAAVESPDKELAYLQMNLAGDIGSAKGYEAVEAVQSIVDSLPKPPGTNVFIAGMSQAAVDEINAVLADSSWLAAVSAALIAILLLVVYRSVSVTALSLLSIGLVLAAAFPMVNLLVEADVLPTSLFTNAIMGALLIGAAADYSIFLIGRYQEGRRKGLSVDAAYRAAYRGVAPVILASGLTVCGGLACMGFAQLDILKSMGLPCAVGMAVATLCALTATPAMLLLGAKWFTLFEPRERGEYTNIWQRIGTRVARWPKPVCAVALGILTLFMLAVPTANFNYDEISFIPKKLESAKGVQAMQEHFPSSQLYPETVLIQSTHDLRNSSDIGTLEQVAQKISQMPDVIAVQWLTRPTGVPLTQTSLGYGISYAGAMLSQNSELIKNRVAQLHTLTENLNQIIGTIDGLQGTLDAAGRQSGGLKSSSSQLTSNFNKLNKQLHLLRQLLQPTIDTTAAKDIKQCLGDQECIGAAKAARGAVSGFASADQLAKALQQLQTLTGSLGEGISGAAASVPLLTRSLSQLRDTVAAVNTAVEPLANQLGVVAYLMQDVGKSSAGNGSFFYFPAALLGDPRIKPYVNAMFSQDGKTTRMIVMGKSSSYSSVGMARAQELAPTVAGALKHTPLEGSTASVSGAAAMVTDTHTVLERDEKVLLVAALTVIFTVVLFLLRSVIAAGVVIASVAISFLSTLGVSVLVWQHILGVQVHWSIPAAVFAVLIAVGADYNMLVVSRFKEEMGAGVRTGVIRSMTGTGAVVTTAGMVFAMTMFSMLGSSLLHLAQLGFTIGVGLIIDTFVVRTFIVPTVAVMLGEKFWWPIRLQDLRP
ncbi:MMPL domain protein [Segniliparus rotundus DSM 44985]|uniref:MMPL domain protein n=1 Tax=Segniliparus rotundus (strain ATCC BAA-972 / CDC 1076 / CIP 108378 / DSM 44985 / JCM 13578) TaxID=640132 RepID=D6ZBJ9_SEGRD|nr:RND family transporter [Segniliparus rotundus]ADG98951.1 MMPL domain protein [Segniliparus rotundus DSM 44985]